MHELAIAQAIVEAAERHAEGRQITVVRVRLGRLRQVVADSLAFYFGLVAELSELSEAAVLEWEEVPSRLRCAGCAAEWDPAPPPAQESAELVVSFRCPRCESSDHVVVSGDELVVESIDVEDPEPGPAATPAVDVEAG